MNYVKNIQTNTKQEKIDYEYLRRLFKGLLIRSQPANTKFEYDWVILPQEISVLNYL